MNESGQAKQKQNNVTVMHAAKSRRGKKKRKKTAQQQKNFEDNLKLKNIQKKLAL